MHTLMRWSAFDHRSHLCGSTISVASLSPNTLDIPPNVCYNKNENAYYSKYTK